MNRRIIAIAAALALSGPAWAQQDPISELAEISGLSERKVNMLLGNRTSFAEYPYTFIRAQEKFEAAIGRDNYQRLLNGESVAIEYRGEHRIVSLDRGKDATPAL